MSNELNELLSDVMNPLSTRKITGAEMVAHSDFADVDREVELCMWFAKWYLDTQLERWEDYEDSGVSTPEDVRQLIHDKEPYRSFGCDNFGLWKKTLFAFSVSFLDDIEGERANADDPTSFMWAAFGTISSYFEQRAEKILEKIQFIYARRYEAMPKEAGQEPEVPEDLKKLRDPLDTDDINIFDLMPDPVYGAKTAVTTEDFVIWFAKRMVSRGVGLSEQNLADKFYSYYGNGFVRKSCNGKDALKIVGLFGLPECADQNNRARDTANASLEKFWKTNKDEIISKVKEITKLWLEHGWL